jgi:hypothetical protein
VLNVVVVKHGGQMTLEWKVKEDEGTVSWFDG